MAGKQTKTMDKTYRFWRNKLMLSMIIGYATFYLTRKSFNFVMPVMQTELYLDKSDIGQIATAFFTELNISTVMTNITRYPRGSVVNSPCCASLEFSASPPHSML